MNKDNASDDFHATHQQHTVIVPRPAVRLKRGGIHRASRASIIREARRMAPQFKDAAAVEVFYGSTDSVDTVVRFDPNEPIHYGM